MRVWWGGGGAMLWVAALLAAMALRTAGEPAPRAPAEWLPGAAVRVARGNRHTPLKELFLNRHPSPRPKRRPKPQRHGDFISLPEPYPGHRSGWHPGHYAGHMHLTPPMAPIEYYPHKIASGRKYDLPLIECPHHTDGMERFACPTSDRAGKFLCIHDRLLCNGFLDCPNGEDEDRFGCMFYKTTMAHLDVMADALLRWSKGR